MSAIFIAANAVRTIRVEFPSDFIHVILCLVGGVRVIEQVSHVVGGFIPLGVLSDQSADVGRDVVPLDDGVKGEQAVQFVGEGGFSPV